LGGHDGREQWPRRHCKFYNAAKLANSRASLRQIHYGLQHTEIVPRQSLDVGCRRQFSAFDRLAQNLADDRALPCKSLPRDRLACRGKIHHLGARSGQHAPSGSRRLASFGQEFVQQRFELLALCVAANGTHPPHDALDVSRKDFLE
jgi:hypothetical protein